MPGTRIGASESPSPEYLECASGPSRDTSRTDVPHADINVATVNRRTFLTTTAAAAIPDLHAATNIPIIDCHIHLFDTSRPQGVPWPDKTDKVLYKTALPDRFRKIAVPLGIVGAIEVEASPWFDDNQWVLDIAAKDKILVGTIGDLEPDKPPFRSQLENLHKNPLFRGIRYGNLW